MHDIALYVGATGIGMMFTVIIFAFQGMTKTK